MIEKELPTLRQDLENRRQELKRAFYKKDGNKAEREALVNKRNRLNGDLSFLRKELTILYSNRDIQEIVQKLGTVSF